MSLRPSEPQDFWLCGQKVEILQRLLFRYSNLAAEKNHLKMLFGALRLPYNILHLLEQNLILKDEVILYYDLMEILKRADEN